MVEENQMSIPYLFRCPISLDLFTDPVTLSTGQTYDRPSIEKWLAGGNSTCPVTMQRLNDFSVVPNHNLRQYIHRWLLRDADNRGSNQASGIPVSLTVLKNSLQCSHTPPVAKLAALRKVRILSAESDVGKSFLIQLGFFPVLFELVFPCCAMEEVHFEFFELALDCILHLSPLAHSNSVNAFKQDAAFDSLVLLLEQGSTKMKTSLCILIEEIASSPTTGEVCNLLGQSRRVQQILVSLLLRSRSDEKEAAAAAAARAIAGICTSSENNRAIAIAEGAVEGLVLYLSSCVSRNVSRALAAMEVLMEEEDGRKAAIKAGALRVVVNWVFRVSAREEGSERAVGVLMALCRVSERAREEAVAAGAVMQLLLLLQSQCSGAAKASARALLKLLKSSFRY
ncbi:U-box domain-containing protein 25 [Platanthera guangdongensis]|uniref:U-box domain-containing protein n=1 Tax=Platanthera guangdongensis TaxID=2320717 RepID=A0ABR2N2E3_9ASPA